MILKKILLGIGVLLVVLIGIGLVASLIWPTINDVKTGETPQYPDLQPQRFNDAYDRIFDASLAIAQAFGWEVTENDRAQGKIQAVATTSVLRFKDDVTITLHREGESVIVNVRSRSRVGKGDLGANARRIRLFQAQLAKRS